MISHIINKNMNGNSKSSRKNCYTISQKNFLAIIMYTPKQLYSYVKTTRIFS